ncbi:hypothetical protein B0H21DRAFT_776610 [Amylocystis lapponica]|nr:hypothetical protein B0H21DRAFT_776610 [Amylocystis lapponica]
MTRQADTNVTASTPRKTGSPRAVRKGKARTRRVSHSSSNSAAASTSKVLQPSRSSSLHNSSLPPTPTSKLKTTIRPIRSASEPRLKSVLETPQNTKGKRKADDLEVTPPDSKNGQHATFAIPPESRREKWRPTHVRVAYTGSQIISESSRPPSSYYRKRPRLSDPSTPTPSPAHSRPGSTQKPPATAAANASWPSRTSGAPQAHSSLASRSASMRSARRPESSHADRRRSLSEISIPISALIAPHAPSLNRSSAYHMHDPRKPPKTTPTVWSLRLRSADEEGSPLQAWCFFIGFILFPIWWVASFSFIPKTREVGGTDTEKAVTLDDPQVERDARTWRTRCRIMAGISFLTYIPFIVLVAVFVPR